MRPASHISSDPPLFWIVKSVVSVSPRTITPKVKLVGFTLITDGSKPVPISPTKKFGSSVSFETNVIEPDTGPTSKGRNSTTMVVSSFC